MSKRERWKPVVGFEGLYEVSDQGEIRGLARWISHPRGGLRLWASRTLVANVLGNNGYLGVSLCRDGERYVRTVHSIVTAAFHGPRPGQMDAAHKNGDRQDNRASNLSWKTRTANHADKIRHGTHNGGERAPHAKLTNHGVQSIRVLASAGEPVKVLAMRFKVSLASIRRVIKRETWKYV